MRYFWLNLRRAKVANSAAAKLAAAAASKLVKIGLGRSWRTFVRYADEAAEWRATASAASRRRRRRRRVCSS